jgi:hypothetical protein
MIVKRVKIECLVGDFPDHKISIIKCLRAAFNIGLKEAKDLADKFHGSDTIIYDAPEKINVDILNRTHEYCYSHSEVELLKYYRAGTSLEMDKDTLLYKVKLLANVALDSDEITLAIDLLTLYNKHQMDSYS